MSSLIEKFYARKYRKDRVEGCVELVCRRHLRHGSCSDCGRKTDNSQIRIDPKTLKRGKVIVCTECYIHPPRAVVLQQGRLSQQRTRDDWDKVTDPIDMAAIEADRMPEQLPGRTRAAIRAFLASPSDVAVVPGVGAETLNNSLATLGLSGDVYAETRDNETVLRKVATP